MLVVCVDGGNVCFHGGKICCVLWLSSLRFIIVLLFVCFIEGLYMYFHVGILYLGGRDIVTYVVVKVNGRIVTYLIVTVGGRIVT